MSAANDLVPLVGKTMTQPTSAEPTDQTPTAEKVPRLPQMQEIKVAENLDGNLAM